LRQREGREQKGAKLEGFSAIAPAASSAEQNFAVLGLRKNLYLCKGFISKFCGNNFPIQSCGTHNLDNTKIIKKQQQKSD